MSSDITVTPPSANITEAMQLADRAHHFTYGDGADPVVGAALAHEAQVYATLALIEAVDNLTDTIHNAAEQIVQAIQGS